MSLPTQKAELDRLSVAWSGGLSKAQRTELVALDGPKKGRGKRTSGALAAISWTLVDPDRDYHVDVDVTPRYDERVRIQLGYHLNPASSPPQSLIDETTRLGGLATFLARAPRLLASSTGDTIAQIVVGFHLPRRQWRPVFRMPTATEIGWPDNAIVSTIDLSFLFEDQPVKVRLGLHEDTETEIHLVVRWSQAVSAVLGDLSAVHDRAWTIVRRSVRKEVSP